MHANGVQAPSARFGRAIPSAEGSRLMIKPPKVTRRRILGGAVAAAAFPAVIPSGVLASPGRPGANDRVVTACIGLGGMGRTHIDGNTAALCDVDARRLGDAASLVPGSTFLTTDFRRVLDRKEIDAVFIAAPDHWHALMTVMACEAGKDVYCEKPACRTVREGRTMIDTARRTGRVVQVGSQGRSHPAAEAATRAIRSGLLGEVRRVSMWHPNNWTTSDPGRSEEPPSELDWSMWLGPARWVDYSPARAHFNHRWFTDFGGGFIRDRGAHALSLMNWALENDAYDGEIEVEATGASQPHGCFDVPVSMEARWRFRARDLTVTWSQPGNPRLGGEWGATYHGDRDQLTVLGGDAACSTEPKALRLGDLHAGSATKSDTVDAGERHRRNFLECVRSREAPVMALPAAVQASNLSNIALIAYRLGRPLVYHAGRERFVGDPCADRFLDEPYRSPWVL